MIFGISYGIIFGIPSALFLFMLAAIVSLLTSFANRLLSNPEQNKAWRKEISDWNNELRKARKEGDKKQMEKLMKKQQYIFQLQGKMSWNSMKVSLIFFVPLLIIWQVLNGALRGQNIAFFPGVGGSLPVPYFGLPVIWWYLLSSLFFSTMLTHAFGLTAVSE